MTGPRITTMWRSRMRRAASWRPGGCRGARPGSARRPSRSPRPLAAGGALGRGGGGRRRAAGRLPEGAAGIARLHELIAAHLGADGDPGQVAVAIETDRGLWVQALVAAGYQVYGLNPKQVARFKERYNLSGAKSDAADAHALADMVRAERHQLRAVAAGTAGAQAVKVAARAHQTLIWERTRHTLRLRSALREFFPAALLAYADLG